MFTRYAVTLVMACMLLTAACSSPGSGQGPTPAPSSSPVSPPTSAAAVRRSSSAASTSPATSTSSGAQIAGTWNGTFASNKYPSGSGTFVVIFTQKGNKIAGAITISSACISKGTIGGTLTGQTIGFGTVHGSSTVNFDGSISGDSMSGSYKSGPSCGNDNGTWRAAR